MEDQRADTGDLVEAETDTEATRRRGGRHRFFRPRPSATPPASDADSEPTTDESATADVEVEAPADAPVPESATEPDSSVEAVPSPSRRKPVTRTTTVVVAVAAALFVAAAAVGGAALQPYLAERALTNTKLEIAQTAAKAITTLFTYTPADVDQLSARAGGYLGGDFADTYRAVLDATAASTKQEQVTRNTEVSGAAVESLDGSTATALVYTNSSNSSPLTQDVPTVRLQSFYISMQRDGSRWQVTGLSVITTFSWSPLAS